MLQAALEHPGPAMVRYPRAAVPTAEVSANGGPLEVGEAEVRRLGHEVALLAFGSLVLPALQAGEALDATVVNMRFVKPLDERLILELAVSHKLLVTIEENAIAGGAGSAVAELLAAQGVTARCVHLGLPDRFIDQASHEEQLASCGLSADGIEASVRSLLGESEDEVALREGGSLA